MKLRRIANLILAAMAGMGLRLFFIAKFSYVSNDAELYQELAQNLIDTGVYGVFAGGSITPAALRMPGYPLFLVFIDWLLGPGNERLFVVQAGIDVLSGLGIAWLAAKLHPRAYSVALWMAILCPFTANYVATPLTETVTIALTTAALLIFCEASGWWSMFAGSLVVGIATYMRPESPLLFPAVGLALVWRYRRDIPGALWPLTRSAVAMVAALVLLLLPFAYRNWVETGVFAPLANPDANLPWEHSFPGVGDWCQTWLVSSDDTYKFGFKLGEEQINPADLPPRAYDSEEERLRAVALIERLNQHPEVNSDVAWGFEQLAKERAARHPFRQHVTVPLLRAVHYWFTPHIETMPYSGYWRPIAQHWEDDPIDFSVTVGYFFLNIAYLTLALWGAWRYRDRFAVLVMVLFIVIRTWFLSGHPSIEPRYMLVCFPALIAMGAAGCFRPVCDTNTGCVSSSSLS